MSAMASPFFASFRVLFKCAHTCFLFNKRFFFKFLCIHWHSSDYFNEFAISGSRNYLLFEWKNSREAYRWAKQNKTKSIEFPIHFYFQYQYQFTKYLNDDEDKDPCTQRKLFSLLFSFENVCFCTICVTVCVCISCQYHRKYLYTDHVRVCIFGLSSEMEHFYLINIKRAKCDRFCKE